ncbi:unnamed protein product [Heterobilharzia americana]|nr:unnamed protein product [Heterobilharzia americana]
MVDRLMNKKSPHMKNNSSSLSSIHHRKCNKQKLEEIIERLTKYDKKKGPVESTSARIMLGFNRYDYGCSPESMVEPNMKK